MSAKAILAYARPIKQTMQLKYAAIWFLVLFVSILFNFQSQVPAPSSLPVSEFISQQPPQTHQTRSILVTNTNGDTFIMEVAQ